jgi:hypothetical protein
MTKKDYELIARILRDARAIGTTGAERHLLDIIASDFADSLAKDNPRFKKERFFAACTPA